MSRSYNSEYPDGYSDYGYEYQQAPYMYNNTTASGYQEPPTAAGYGWYPVPDNWQPPQGLQPQAGYQQPPYFSFPPTQEMSYQHGQVEQGPVREMQGAGRGKHSYSQNRNRVRQSAKPTYTEAGSSYNYANEYGNSETAANDGQAEMESSRWQEVSNLSGDREINPRIGHERDVMKYLGEKVDMSEGRTSETLVKPPSTDLEAAEWLKKQLKTRDTKQGSARDNSTRSGGRFRGTDSRTRPFTRKQQDSRQQDDGADYRREGAEESRPSINQANTDSSYRDKNRSDRSKGVKPKYNDRPRYGGSQDPRHRPDITTAPDDVAAEFPNPDMRDTKSGTRPNFARQSNKNNNAKYNDREIPKSAQLRDRNYQYNRETTYKDPRDRNRQYSRREDKPTKDEESVSRSARPADKAFSRSRDNYGRFSDMYNLSTRGDAPENKEDTETTVEATPDVINRDRQVRKPQPRAVYESRGSRNKKPSKVYESQRSVLMDQLSSGSYDCMVCYESVRVRQPVWSCCSCYHVFHLRCIKQWTRSPNSIVAGADKDGWRCPACQNLTFKFPNEYWCFCGKARDPEFNRMETPHSCGAVCQKNRGEDCKHPCNMLCHPGPCPECVTMVTKSCACGKSKQTVKCGQSADVRCTGVCGRQLNCSKHFCRAVCHIGSCDMCVETVHQECYGGHEQREVVCGSEQSFTESYTCSAICSKTLDCGNHTCEATCHEGPCTSCPLLPANITHCPCGSRPSDQLPGDPRTSCLAPIPTCDGPCNKPLACGPSDQPHVCDKKCHEGPCGPCQGMTEVTCRCRALEKDFKCSELPGLTEEGGAFLCDKRCNRKKTCGRHKCGQLCCVRTEHPCDAVCGKKLECGLHRCEEACHRSNCPSCLMASFDELMCYCGAEVMFPPIPCSTRPPECHRPCTRQHSCDHQVRHNCHSEESCPPCTELTKKMCMVRHNCHSEESCPPCTELTKKMCMGGHVMRNNIVCHLTDISCGMACNRVLTCGQHRCVKICHKGSCVEGDEVCKQLCQRKRPLCDHVCGAPCHCDDPCPDFTCKAKAKLKCACGNREATTVCGLGGTNTDMNEYQKITMQSLADSLQGKLGCTTLDIGKFTAATKAPGSRVLECNEECALFERNKRFALALEIQNPDLTAKLGSPSYSDFLKDYARQYPQFVSGVEKELGDLVQAAKQSKHASRSHSFPIMNNNQRRLIHELAEFYGCETQSYDYEPNKSVVASAKKDRCWLPAVTLTAYIQRELHPRAPPPIPHVHKEETLRQSNQAAKQSTAILGDASGRRSPGIEGWQKVGKKTKKPAATSGVSAIDVIDPPAGGYIEYSALTKESKDALKTQPVVDYFDFTVN